MGILFLVALVLAWPTFGLSLVAFFALRLVRGYLQAKAQMEGKQRRADFRTLMEPLFQGRIEEFFLTLDIPRWAWADGEVTKEEARDCMKHILYFFSDNPDEAAQFMRALESHRVKSGAAGLDPISVAFYERNRNIKGEIHLLVYRAIATIKTANPSLRCFDKVDVAELGLRIVDLLASPPAEERHLCIASQVGQELSPARWISLFKRIGRYESNKLLSSTQALDAALIQRLEGSWDWQQLSRNEGLPWSLELIERYVSRWRWSDLSSNKALPWSMELISRYEDRWDWERLAGNTALPWSLDLIERYVERWEWGKLSEHPALPWSMELISRYEDRWDWERLSSNTALPWSLDLIERYVEQWVWVHRGKWYLGPLTLSGNPALPWSLDLIKRYEDRWDWGRLSRNTGVPWSLGLIERYEDRWDWERELSNNVALPWSLDVIDQYMERWAWEILSGNPALPWSLDLIERYENRWEWAFLSGNPGLPWSTELVSRFVDRWNWNHERVVHLGIPTLSENTGLPWSTEFIERYEDKWGWESLSRNEALPWSIELIERFAGRWDWELIIENKAFRMAIPELSSSEVVEVMARVPE